MAFDLASGQTDEDGMFNQATGVRLPIWLGVCILDEHSRVRTTLPNLSEAGCFSPVFDIGLHLNWPLASRGERTRERGVYTVAC